MGSVLLVIHLMTAIFLVILILMQRSNGGALSGLGGASGANSFLSARGTGNLLTRLTAILATVFFITSISLSIYYRGAMKPQASIVDTVAQSSSQNKETTPDSSVPSVPLDK